MARNDLFHFPANKKQKQFKADFERFKEGGFYLSATQDADLLTQ
jgi:hypothetical protein